MDLLPPTSTPASPPDRERQRRAGGRRSAHVAERSSRRRRLGIGRMVKWAGLILSVISVLAAAVLGITALDLGKDAPVEEAAQGVVAAPLPQTVLLLIRTDAAVPGAAGVTLLATATDGRSSATFIPSTTLVEIPGVGLDRLGLAQQYGGADLLTATVENAMGIQIDGSLVIDRAGLGSLLQRAGGAEIDIPDRLIDRQADGTGTVAFDQGPQFLNGLRLAEYWAFDQRGETELDSFPRQQRALDAMFRALDDQSLLDTMFADIPAELDTGVPAEELRQVVGTMADAAADGVVVYQLLPVVPFGSADETLGASYQMQAEDVASLVAEQFPGAVPEGGASAPLALQVLNGVGVPGIGQQVDLALRGLDVRIVRTDNARSFDFPTTRIVIYQESAEVMRVARQVQQAMGVGTIQISRQPQSVVDMTLVVGGDFLG